MSVHGICFDEGQGGNCGIFCEGFKTYECTIREEIIEIACEDGSNIDEILEETDITDEELFEYDVGYEYLAEKYIGEFRRAIMKAQTKYKYDEKEYLRKRIFGEETNE